ncbi:MAG: cation:proton antiporter [Actinomycetes bacterium]
MPPTALTPAQVLAFVLLDLVIILVAARLMGTLARRIGQPFVVGEIVAGVLLGPTLLGPTVFTWGDSWSFLSCETALAATQGTPSITTCLFPPQARGVLGVVGQLALIFFMFLVGLELDWSLLKGRLRGIAMVAVGVVALPLVAAFALAPLLFDDAFAAEGAPRTGFVLFVGAMLSVTAFPVMARILQEKGLSSSAMGATGVAAAAVVTILMFLLVSVAVGVSEEQPVSDIVRTFVYAGLYLAVMGLVVRRALLPLGRRYEQAGRLTPDVFAVVLLVALASSYAAHQIGINVIVGAFVAGAVLPARTRLFRDLSTRLADITGVLLLPVFLAFSGLNTDFTVLRAEHLVGLLVFLVAAIASKWLGGALSARAAGLTWAEGNVLGVLMNCRGLLVLVVALVGVNSGVITPVMQVGAVLVALVTTMMTGPLFDVLIRRVPAAEPAADMLPLAPGTQRVLAVVDDPRDSAVVVDAAYRLAAGRVPAEVLLVRAVAPSATGSSVEDSARDAAELDRTARAAAVLRPLAPAGVTVREHTFLSPTAADDVLAVANSAAVVTVAWRPAERASSPGSVLVERLLREAPSGVVVCRVQTDQPERRDPVALLVGSGPTELAAEVAAAAGRDGVGASVPVDDERAAVAAARDSGTVVVSVPPPSDGERLGDGSMAFVLAVAGGPAYLVREPAPAGVPLQGTASATV